MLAHRLSHLLFKARSERPAVSAKLLPTGQVIRLPASLLLVLLAVGCAFHREESLSQPRPGAREDGAAVSEPVYSILLPKSGASSLQVGLPLSASEIRASIISVILEWRTSGTECDISVTPSIAARTGRGRATTSGDAAGVLRSADETDLLRAGPTPNEVGWKGYLLTLKREGPSGAGEVIALEFLRDPEAEGDSCDSDLVITAVRFSAGAQMASDAMRLSRDERSRELAGLSQARSVALRPR